MFDLFKDSKNSDHLLFFSCLFAFAFFLIGSTLSVVIGIFLLIFAISMKFIERDFDSYMLWASFFLVFSRYPEFQNSASIISSLLLFVSLVFIGLTVVNIFDSLE